MRIPAGVALIPLLLGAAPAPSPRDLLVYAAYEDRSAVAALARIDVARAQALASLARDPSDQDAAVVAGIALAYRAKLTGNRTEALAARRGLEVVVQRFPRNAEAHLALGGWHIGVINKVGRLLARAGAGARQDVGYAELDRAVALGGDRAVFPAIAGMVRLEQDTGDARGRALVEAAARAGTPTPLDRINQRAAGLVAAAIRKGDGRVAGSLADRLLPFGWVRKD